MLCKAIQLNHQNRAKQVEKSLPGQDDKYINPELHVSTGECYSGNCCLRIRSMSKTDKMVLVTICV